MTELNVNNRKQHIIEQIRDELDALSTELCIVAATYPQTPLAGVHAATDALFELTDQLAEVITAK